MQPNTDKQKWVSLSYRSLLKNKPKLMPTVIINESHVAVWDLGGETEKGSLQEGMLQATKG